MASRKSSSGDGEKTDEAPLITVVIPTLNEEESLAAVLEEIEGAFSKKYEAGQWEVLVVDGLSKDRTVEIAKDHGCRVYMEKRRGYGRAYKSGFSNARGSIICTLDGDTTYPAVDFPRLISMLDTEGLDFLNCDRLTTLEKGVMSFTHRFGNWVLTTCGNMLFGIRIKDNQTGMWVFRKEILDKLDVTSDGMAFSEEIKIEAFLHTEVRAKEIAVKYRKRVGEVKLNTYGDGRKNLAFLFSKRKARKQKAKKAKK
jgi:glycosyltransferase involved in cell wall biosynthesis